MSEDKNLDGLFVGTCFTAGSLLLTLTYIVPIFSVLPGVLFEKVAAALVPNEPYSNVGKLTIVLLAVTFLLVLGLFLRNIRKQVMNKRPVSKAWISVIMGYCWFLVHPLGFYLYWGIGLGFRGDGQLMFGAFESCMISSFAFIIIGLLIDRVKNVATS